MLTFPPFPPKRELAGICIISRVNGVWIYAFGREEVRLELSVTEEVGFRH